LSAGNISRASLISPVVLLDFWRRLRSRIRARIRLALVERPAENVCDRDDVTEGDDGIGGGAGAPFGEGAL
jgi:hypothetical protein